MNFDLSTSHLGDILMAMPAMRAGDHVVANPKHRVPGLPVTWLDAGKGLHARPRSGQHTTDAWLRETCREPVFHHLLQPVKRTEIVIAPQVDAAAKRWPWFEELRAALPQAVVAHRRLGRRAWMGLLNCAHTVICPDTGTAHMADALGVHRVIALHGVPSNWPRCAPYWNRNHCIARGSMREIAVDDVLEVLNA